ncbi:MAG: hypothetical protein RL660_3079 [Bacteroidota bacterium]|jgi:predicted metal-dependent HD superfamily phosphohydrolase
MLQEIFLQTLIAYDVQKEHRVNLWQEIHQHYTSPARHYHTLEHLANMYSHLLELKQVRTNWHAVLFALFYHDLVYDATRSDNEEQSALIAMQRLSTVNVPQEVIDECVVHILATKHHGLSTLQDTNYFTDADISILGQERLKYLNYAQQIRQEYIIYAGSVYNAGRKQVLQNFLNKEKIYHTTHFADKFEASARENLLVELNLLHV